MGKIGYFAKIFPAMLLYFHKTHRGKTVEPSGSFVVVCFYLPIGKKDVDLATKYVDLTTKHVDFATKIGGIRVFCTKAAMIYWNFDELRNCGKSGILSLYETGNDTGNDTGNVSGKLPE